MIENVHFPPLGPPGPTENDFLMLVVVMFVLEMLGARSNTTYAMQILSVKGGGGGVPLIPVTFFLDQKHAFVGQKTPFLALFEENLSGQCL